MKVMVLPKEWIAVVGQESQYTLQVLPDQGISPGMAVPDRFPQGVLSCNDC